jgi:regulator of protease activity HflC (stomatin/prohibitin superfamily)
LLIGVVIFVSAIAITSHRQEHVVTRLKRAFRNNEADVD